MEFREQASTQTRTIVINTNLTWNSFKSSLPKPSPFSIFYILIHDSTIELATQTRNLISGKTNRFAFYYQSQSGWNGCLVHHIEEDSEAMSWLRGGSGKVGDPCSEHGEGTQGLEGHMFTSRGL